MTLIKKLTSLFSLLFLLNELKTTIKRFPFPVMCSVFLFAFSFAEINDLTNFSPEMSFKIIVICIAGFFLGGAIKLYCEACMVADGKGRIASLMALIILAVLVLMTPQGAEERFAALILSALAMVSVGAFIFRKSNDVSIWSFNRQVVFGGAISFIAALILFAGASGALASIGYLFEIKIHGDVYSTLWVFGASLVAPLYALSFVPRQFDVSEQECHMPSQVGFIANWILAPLVAVYIAILYAYFIKIGVTFDIPKNQLAYMIAGFALAGIITYQVSWPFVRSGHANRLLRFLMRFLFPVLVLPIIVMIVAIMIRIDEYGVTEKRYVVALAALWFLFLAAGFTFKKLQLKHIGLSFAVILFLGACGPWGMTQVSQQSQFSRLEKLIDQYGLIEEGKIVKAKKEIPFVDRKNISSIVQYLSRTPYKETIKAWLPESENESASKGEGLSPAAVTNQMGFDFVNRYAAAGNKERFHVNANIHDLRNIKVQGFDYILSNLYARLDTKDINRNAFASETDQALPKITWEFNENGLLMVRVEGHKNIAFDVAALAKENHHKDVKALSLDGLGQGMKIRLVFKQISGTVKDDNYEVTDASFFMLLDL